MAIMFEDIRAEEILLSIIKEIHSNGPISSNHFETLAYIKKFNPDVFGKHEQTLLYVLGLFYKLSTPENFMETVYSIYSDSIKDLTGHSFTPLQASAYTNIKDKRFFSFSAPTSAGKSHLFREMIKEADKDIVIIVPSRALIAEYMYIIQNIFKNDTSVLILQFIENINVEKTIRRVYIITPERGNELFKFKNEINVGLFLLDEAQDMSDEVRNIRFDTLVRRIAIEFPNSKMVFTQPFTKNPEGQLKKHNFLNDSNATNYEQLSVGKIYLEEDDRNLKYFSPHQDPSSVRIDKVENNIISEILKNEGTVLVYISKDKIYKGLHLEEFKEFVALCPLISNENALRYIEELQNYIGSKDSDPEKQSVMIHMMKRGIVIHHGSIPLKGRLIIERFVNEKFARMCFATSTLLQGINMPFDAVWIDNFHDLPTLALKNLIGRAGRSTTNKEFNYGYVIVKHKNVKTFSERINDTYSIKETSKLEENIQTINEDVRDTVEAIKNNDFNDNFQLTNTQVQRLDPINTENDILFIMNTFLKNGRPLTAKEYYELGTKRDKLKNCFKNLFSMHLRRRTLTNAEQSVLSASIPILLWQIQGKSFKEALALRHSFISRKEERRQLEKAVKNKEITKKEADFRISQMSPKFSIIAQALPNIKARNVPLFKLGSALNINYDLLVYDTYDYIDKVISLSIGNPLYAAFLLYYEKNNDNRALAMANYIKYGTNDTKEVWLLRYGFSFDDIEWIKDCVEHIDEKKISFGPSLTNLSAERKSILYRYL